MKNPMLFTAIALFFFASLATAQVQQTSADCPAAATSQSSNSSGTIAKHSNTEEAQMTRSREYRESMETRDRFFKTGEAQQGNLPTVTLEQLARLEEKLEKLNNKDEEDGKITAAEKRKISRIGRRIEQLASSYKKNVAEDNADLAKNLN